MLAAIAVPAGVAFADAAGPTDYETTITAITPRVAGVDVSVVGGDSFLRLVVEPGIEVVVLGYQQEPYLRIRADGVVEENERSPAIYLNADRYGSGTPPAGADPQLPPNWTAVGDGGAWSWHDHRAHWMSPDPPADASRGTVIQSGTIPLVVDGAPVSVDVTTTLAAGAVPAPARRRRRGRAGPRCCSPWGAELAWRGRCSRHRSRPAAIGCWQFRSLPAETGPLIVWWLLPVVAAGSVLVALCSGGGWWRTRSSCSPRSSWAPGCGCAAGGRAGDHPDGRSVLARPRRARRGGHRRRRRRRRGDGGDVPDAVAEDRT